MTNPTPHPHAAVIHAYADGHEVEYFDPVSENWCVYKGLSENAPLGHRLWQWRIKPVPERTYTQAEVDALLADQKARAIACVPKDAEKMKLHGSETSVHFIKNGWNECRAEMLWQLEDL